MKITKVLTFYQSLEFSTQVSKPGIIIKVQLYNDVHLSSDSYKKQKSIILIFNMNNEGKHSIPNIIWLF